jgi:hypothetical protein
MKKSMMYLFLAPANFNGQQWYVDLVFKYWIQSRSLPFTLISVDEQWQLFLVVASSDDVKQLFFDAGFSVIIWQTFPLRRAQLSAERKLLYLLFRRFVWSQLQLSCLRIVFQPSHLVEIQGVTMASRLQRSLFRVLGVAINPHRLDKVGNSLPTEPSMFMRRS